MAIFNSFLYVYQRVFGGKILGVALDLSPKHLDLRWEV